MIIKPQKNIYEKKINIYIYIYIFKVILLSFLNRLVRIKHVGVFNSISIYNNKHQINIYEF